MTYRWLWIGGTLVVASMAGCAAGDGGTDGYTSPPPDAAEDTGSDSGTDAQADTDTEANVETGPDVSDEPLEDAEPDTTADGPADGPGDTALDTEADAQEDAEEAGDAGCPAGYTGPACDECAAGYVACDDACVGTCESCTGKSFECDGTCAADCKTCTGATSACDQVCIPGCETCDSKEIDCNGMCVAGCGDCIGAPYACDDTCVTSCMTCAGHQATCEATMECLAGCSACAGTCLECPAGYHACTGGCHVDVADVPSLGCAYTCDDQPCMAPANGESVCTQGACDFVCNTSSGFQKVGSACLCDTANGFVEHPTLHICVCETGTKGCGSFCASVTDPVYGCSSPYCTACPSPAHAVSTSCNAAGSCDFTCDATAGYVKNASGTACVCPSGMVDSGAGCHCPTGQKLCGGVCVSALTPDHGCAGANCDPCVVPPHAASTNCAGPGGTCGFACDTANGYVVNAAGTDCTCAPGLVDYGTYCGCPGGEKSCGGVCVSTSLPSTGCASASCSPCPEPSHATATCGGTGGTCSFTCDASGQWVASGSSCVCDTGWKDCGGDACVPVSTASGCSSVSCTPCPSPAHATSVSCTGPGGTCAFTCDAAGQWVAVGNQCVCNAGWKDCGGAACVDASLPVNGCADASCSTCPLPAHATSTNCNGAGGTCDFVCDGAGHWVKSGSQCVCDSGYTEVGGTCVPACPGSTYGSSCYWYVSAAATWDAAQATCASSGGHLATVANASENSFVRGLGTGSIWLGLRDYSTVQQSIGSADDCTDNVWLSGNGGTYLGSTDEYDDLDPCGLYSDADDIFGLTVTVPGIYVFSTANTGWDTILGLYNRVNSTTSYLSCVGTSIECDDDDGPGTRSLIIRYLNAGSYTLIMDGYSGYYGSYQLDVRRFDMVDGTVHGFANWATDEPNNSGSSEDCVEVNAAGGWNDLGCSATRPYVCERPL